jgi:hypothetical protein
MVFDVTKFLVPESKAKTERGALIIRNHNAKVIEIGRRIEADDKEWLCKAVTFTEHSKKSKMAFKHSISTSVRLNPYCQARQCMRCRADGKEPVCPYCFANAISNARPTVDYSTTRNSEILWNVEIPSDVWRKVRGKEVISWHEPDARIQSLADVACVRECRNYIHLTNAFPEMRWVPWSKNDWFWWNAFQQLGKPENMNYIHSSLFLNEIDEGPIWMQPFIDYIFTVFTEEFARLHPEIVMNCCTLTNKGRQCRRDCNDCYVRGKCRYRNELVRGYKGGEKTRK